MDKYEKVAVVIPCYNEEAAIRDVVLDFKAALPDAKICVFNNASSDRTAEIAREAGATVYSVAKKGKGNVVRAIFRDVEVEYYIMIDGDGTYAAQDAVTMLEVMKKNRADMVVGNRMINYAESDSRAGHYMGNKSLTHVVNSLFGSNYQDLLSGYRVLSRRFVKSIPLFTEGFEVETNLSIHAIDVDARVEEVAITYSSRAEGTESKLNTIKDGVKIAAHILALYRDRKPTVFYGCIAMAFWLAGLLVGVPVIIEFFETGLVPKFPSAILASGLAILGFLTFFSGMIISATSKNRREIKKLLFLSAR